MNTVNRPSRIVSPEEKRFYFENGFLLVKNVYKTQDIEKIRSLIETSRENGVWSSAPYSNEGVTTDIYRLIPELIPLVFNREFVSVMQSLLGEDSVLIPEPAIHRNRFYYWHKDGTFLDEQYEKFHYDPSFHAVMTAMYLQSNDPVFGGGLTVFPKSQNSKDQYWKLSKMGFSAKCVFKIKKILGISFLDKLEKNKTNHWIPSEPGDMVILNMRVDHKGSPRIEQAPYDKYGIFQIVCKDSQWTSKLCDCLRKRDSAYYQKFLAKDHSMPESLDSHLKQLGMQVDY